MIDYIEVHPEKASTYKLSGLDGIVLLCSKGIALYKDACLQDMFSLFKGAFWFATKEHNKALYCNYNGNICMFRGLKRKFNEEEFVAALNERDIENIIEQTLSLGDGALIICH